MAAEAAAANGVWCGLGTVLVDSLRYGVLRSAKSEACKLKGVLGLGSLRSGGLAAVSGARRVLQAGEDLHTKACLALLPKHMSLTDAHSLQGGRAFTAAGRAVARGRR